MRHFEAQTIATRYARYRPQVHHEVFGKLKLPVNSQVTPEGKALDVACGTGHSTVPLLKLAEHVIGCDVSEAMLREARRTCPAATFVTAPAEALPLEGEEADLVTVGFAFHWFDQIAFLREAARVLKPGGSLVLYNFYFAGVMAGNPAFAGWFQETYLARFPVPHRHRTPLQELLTQIHSRLEIAETHALEPSLTLTSTQLRNYLTTQSNVSTQLEAGESLDAIDSFLDAGLEPLFRQDRERFSYPGQVTRLVRG